MFLRRRNPWAWSLLVLRSRPEARNMVLSNQIRRAPRNRSCFAKLAIRATEALKAVPCKPPKTDRQDSFLPLPLAGFRAGWVQGLLGAKAFLSSPMGSCRSQD